MNIRPDLNRRQFLQTTALAASALPFMGTATEPLPYLGCSSISDQLKRFVAEKRAQAIAAAQAVSSEILPA